MSTIVVMDEACDACLMGDHGRHQPRQVYGSLGTWIGDRRHCHCARRGRRRGGRQRSWLATGILVWTAVMALAAVGQVGLWLLLKPLG